MTRRIAVTGAPGSGKTTLLAGLAGPGVEVVAEAATEVNEQLLLAGYDRPHQQPEFLERIVGLQRQRRLGARGDVQLHDRTAFCTVALARYLGEPEPAMLCSEVDDVRKWFEPRALFVCSLGFVVPTPVRRISFREAKRFEAVHREVYFEHGFTLIDVEAASVERRRTAVLAYLDSSP